MKLSCVDAMQNAKCIITDSDGHSPQYLAESSYKNLQLYDFELFII